MAEYTFSVLTTRTSLKEQCIYIDFSLDLDEDTVNSGKIYLINDDSKKLKEIFEESKIRREKMEK